MEDDDNEMVLREFMEALAVVAVWLDPCPHRTVGARLKALLKNVVIPNCTAKSHIDAFIRKYRMPKNA